jgi:hypothetical protein
MQNRLCQSADQLLGNLCSSTKVYYSVLDIVLQILQLYRSMGFPAIMQR